MTFRFSRQAFVTLAATLALTAAFILSLALTHQVGAVTDLNSACSNAGSSLLCDARGEDVSDGFAQNLTNLLLFILGIGAVIMIVIGGIKYATANGEASKIASAKNTILYSVVGLVVALLAWGIVRFVIEQFS